MNTLMNLGTELSRAEMKQIMAGSCISSEKLICGPGEDDWMCIPSCDITDSRMMTLCEAETMEGISCDPDPEHGCCS